MDRVDEIDALAHRWTGFVAQPTLLDEGQVYVEPMLLNVFIWKLVESLREFTYASVHAELLTGELIGLCSPIDEPMCCFGTPLARSRRKSKSASALCICNNTDRRPLHLHSINHSRWGKCWRPPITGINQELLDHRLD